MNPKRLLLLVLLGVLVGLTIFWVPGRFADSSSGDDGQAPAAGSSQSGAPGADGSPGAKSGSKSGSRDKSKTDSKRATEALPKAASSPTESGLPGLSTKPKTKTEPAALISEPLPKQAMRKNALVAGYPDALEPPSRAGVQISSVSPSKGVLQVALTATCRRPCDVLRHYRASLAKHGFEEIAASSVENVPAASLRRGEESVSISVTKTTRRTVEFALIAMLHTKT
ncbi:hypothetical protein J2S40_000286 [Nocardioides luteus]|uniref:LytR/CpsA/Psr regulator C-terminal domain-containing protein n=1 Tax=Nocardioides luteus TaxID=1844 RepID=A0ABQ5STY8_9ACTN|nr:hypothetical protein [Nocardioides luteus]MDR7309228.1 hypothetical protein [Nocardioides luteus]GGR48936.1 hypothetical protein GCM10010197_13440 [Nocardioides luteus]GLJ67633.1 hypothetical protein GCM10017579_16690 [Nocardioides luteus]